MRLPQPHPKKKKNPEILTCLQDLIFLIVLSQSIENICTMQSFTPQNTVLRLLMLLTVYSSYPDPSKITPLAYPLLTPVRTSVDPLG